MRSTSKEKRNTLSIRITETLNQKLAEHADKIGISKNALISQLIFREFEKEAQEHKK